MKTVRGAAGAELPLEGEQNQELRAQESGRRG